ncbi:MAG: transglutaminase-like domain-containing protein, partial [Pseudomonadota bacterium]
ISTARQWRSQVNSHRDYIDRVLQYYRDNFIYTLSPPKLGTNTVDEFLFSTQRGFCEHFSSSFVVLMRAVGIPARVVVGYQGGKWSEDNKFLTIRQYDAHAWAEVWLDNRWMRVDPTAAVAPNRIEQGLFDALSEQDQQLVERLPLSSFNWVNRLALQLESINYRWQRWVLSYDQEKQAQLLQKILGEVTTARLAALLIIPASVILLLSSLLLLKRSTKSASREQKIYRYFCKRLQTLGIDAAPTETITQLCSRAISQRKDKEQELINVRKVMECFLYQRPQALSKQEYKEVLKVLGQL